MAEYICPHCKNPIEDDDALLCHFCGESLNRSCGGLGRMKTWPWKWTVVVIAALIIVSLILSMR